MLPIMLDRESNTPIYRQIAEQIRAAVGRGDLREGDRLPTTRALSTQLGVNRLTVSKAYEELSEEGRVSSHVGRGTFVRAPGQAEPPAVAGEENLPSPVNWPTLFSRTSEKVGDEGLPAASMGTQAPGLVSFASLFPDPTLFPIEPFRRSLDTVLRKEGHRVLGYGPPAGMPALRKVIAGTLRARGMEVHEGQVVITNGSQQGIDLVARALLDAGDRVLVENPTYTGAVQVFHSYGAELVGVPVDAEGAIVSRLQEAVERHRPKLIYLMPNFQNPTSETMSLARRRALIELAVARGVPILEDDFGGDLRFEGPDLPALKALDRGGAVVYLSTFAKKLLPGLRIGWIAAPPPMAERLARLKKVTDYSTSLLLQAALLHFISHGDLDRHLAHVLARYRERRDAMLSAMKRAFPAEASWSRPRGGLVVWVTLPAGVDADQVAAEAAQRSVLVGRGDLFYVDGGTRQNLRLTFAQAGPRDIHAGIRVLGEIIKQNIRARRSARRATVAEALPLI